MSVRTVGAFVFDICRLPARGRTEHRMLMDRPARGLLDAFSSAEPAPGGGSASALAGALGASLLMMVTALPKTRTGSDADRAALDETREQLGVLREALIALVDRDSEAYERVISAYRRPKATDEEKAARKAAIQEAMEGAIATPLEMMRAAHDALGLAPAAARHGNPSASSDVRVGLELLAAAVTGARLNVDINLGSLADRDRAREIAEEVERVAGGADDRRAAALAALA